MTVKILLRFPALTVTQESLHDLCRRSLRHASIDEDRALAAILGTLEALYMELEELREALTGERLAVIDPGGMVTFRKGRDDPR